MDSAEVVSSILDELAADRLIAFADGIPNFLASDAVLLLSGFRSMSPSAVSLAPNGSGVLAVTPEWDATRAREAADGRLGVVGRNELAASEWEKSLTEWRHALPADVENDKIAEIEKKLGQTKHRVAQKSSVQEAKPQ